MADKVQTARRHAYALEGAAYLLIIVAAIVLFGGFIPLVRFASEEIRITVDEDRIFVDGLYRYRNSLPFPVTQGLSSPTPSGDGLGPAEDFTIERLPLGDGDAGALVPARIIGGTPYFEVRVPARSTIEVRVCYTQRHDGRHGRYILTTTGAWGKPLEHGIYSLDLRGMRLEESGYPLRTDGNGLQVFERTDFMPTEDWAFTFRKEAP
jgi:hypothetical protein